MRCRGGCGRDAVWNPVVLLYVAGVPRELQHAARGRMAVGLCDHCRAHCRPEHLLGDAEFARIAGVFRQLRREDPDRERIGLDWIRVGEKCKGCQLAQCVVACMVVNGAAS